MSGHTVLILGAGASLVYGLPLGKGLIEKICDLLPKSDASYMGDKAAALHNQLQGYRFLKCTKTCPSRNTFAATAP